MILIGYLKESTVADQAWRKETTSHPYIVKNKDVCDGSPIIEGTRTRVIDIAVEYDILGHSPDEIGSSFLSWEDSLYSTSRRRPA